MVTESEAGITCYMNKLPGFRGILKQRYSDFIVNEVSSNGELIRLTDLDPPADGSTIQRLDGTQAQADGVGNVTPATPDQLSFQNSDDVAEFRGLVGDEATEQLEELLRRVSEGSTTDLAPLVLAPDSEKAHRADLIMEAFMSTREVVLQAVHSFVKCKLPFLVTDTVDGSDGHAGSKCVRIRYFPGGISKSGYHRDREWKGRKSKRQKRAPSQFEDVAPFDTRGREGNALKTPKFLLFHLFKENKNTQDALMVLGRMLGIQPKSFGFAGTKDKRGVSTQQVTVFKQSATRVASLNTRLFGIKVGNFRYVEKSLCLGDLLGNHFIINLRNISADDSAVAQAAEALKERGFINYFGLQRFGNSDVSTHSVGAALLRGEWKEAAHLVLQPRNGELAEIAEARKHFEETGDVDAALLEFPRYMGSERAVLGGLKKNPGNWLQSFSCIPRPMRQMFVHSYQSYLWNHAVSYRLSTYGQDKVVEGDLVRCDEPVHNPTIKCSENPNESNRDESDEQDVGETDLFCQDFIPEGLRNVKVVSVDDVAANKYDISDVVLPLPGACILYPTNSTGEVYHALAKKDQVDLNTSPHSVKEYSMSCLTGGYRNLVQRPKDFRWETKAYDDVTEPLCETDLDEVMSRSGREKLEKEDSSRSLEYVDEKSITGVRSGLRKALQLHFTLSASSYATMAVRELLKQSTSVAFHKALNEDLGDTACDTNVVS